MPRTPEQAAALNRLTIFILLMPFWLIGLLCLPLLIGSVWPFIQATGRLLWAALPYTAGALALGGAGYLAYRIVGPVLRKVRRTIHRHLYPGSDA